MPPLETEEVAENIANIYEHRDDTDFNEYGIDINGLNRDGYNKNCIDENGLDREGYNINGIDRNGIDRDGYNINGIERTIKRYPKRKVIKTTKITISQKHHFLRYHKSFIVSKICARPRFCQMPPLYTTTETR